MSVLQVEDLVSYQLRASYLNEFADGVGERLITLNESIVNSAPFKAAGWRTNPGLIKRTHSPPIPTAVASEYFRAPRSLGFTLEDDLDDSGGLLGGGARGGMGGDLGAGGGPGGPGRLGGDSLMSGAGGALTGSSEMAGPAITAATKRRRRREQMEEDDDSSDLSDESDDDGTAEQRAAQQIKFAKMPTRFRSGSSPLQSSNLRQPPIGVSDSPPTPSTVAPPSRGSISQSQSQSALESVKERSRRDTVTSSEVSSENEFDASGFHRLRERDRSTAVAAAAAAAAAAGMGGTGRRTRQRQTSSKTVRMRSNSSAGSSGAGSLKPTVRRQDSDLLEEEREMAASDDDEESDGEDGEDASDLSSTFAGSIDSASILHADADNPLNAPATQDPIIGTPPREFTRASTVRRSQHPAMLEPVGELPPPRPMSTMRPVSTVAPRSLLTAALQAKKAAAAMPFERFASFSGKGDPNPILVRIYAPQSTRPTRPYEVPIRPTVHQEQGPGERPVTVADLIGLSLWRYSEEKCEPPLPAGHLHVNWWTLRMVEEGGEVDDDFPPLERTRPLTSFTTVNNSSKTTGTRFRSNSKVYDEFALVEASASEFAENQRVTPQYEEEKGGGAEAEGVATAADRGIGRGGSDDGDRTPRNATPQPGAVSAAAAAAAATRAAASGLGRLATGDRQFAPLDQPRLNPIITTTYRHNAPHADAPAVPAAAPNTARGRKKMLRVHIHSADAPPGQLITMDVTTDMYLEEVLDMVCRKRQLDKSSHVLKLTGSGAVVRTDRPVASLENVADLDLYRKRFATEGSATGSPLGTSSGFVAAASSPKMLASYGAHSRRAAAAAAAAAAAISASVSASTSAMPSTLTMPSVHPLAREVSDASYKQYTVWRRQGLKLMGSSERVITIDGEYVHIGGASTGKITTVHFSNVVGCKVSLRHPTHFKLIVYKATESKRYDFEVKSADEASEIVAALKKAMSPYRDI